MSFYHEKLCKGLHFNVSELCRILAAAGWTDDEIEAAIIEWIRKEIATARQLERAVEDNGKPVTPDLTARNPGAV